MELNRGNFTSDIHKSQRYKAKTPEPNYSEFKQLLKKKNVYIDLLGREYLLAEGSARDNYTRRGYITNTKYREANPTLIEDVGTLLFWIRIPIKLKNHIPFPDPTDENLTLYFPRDQVICRGITDGVFYSGPKKKTGYVVIRNFKTFGQVSNPKEYEDILFRRFVTKAHLF